MLTQRDMSFEDMAARYGEVVAYQYLEQIERAAGLCPRTMIGVSPEYRLTHALRLQDEHSSYRLAA